MALNLKWLMCESLFLFIVTCMKLYLLIKIFKLVSSQPIQPKKDHSSRTNCLTHGLQVETTEC